MKQLNKILITSMLKKEGKVTITKKIDEDEKKITCHFLKRNGNQWVLSHRLFLIY